MWVKWPGTHQVTGQWWSKTVLGIALDANGNTLSDPSGKAYTWDFDNQLTQAVAPGTGAVTFKYDPFGRRIQKSGPIGTTNYLYDGSNLLEEIDNSGNVLARYTQGTGIDQPLTELRSGSSSYYQQDAIGSVTSLSNSSGVLANTYTYDSFGNLTASTGTVTNPFQYTGREFDAETGRYFYRARYFDQSIGRFISEDPVGFKGGINFYAYVLNNPINLSDPTGLKGCKGDCTKAPPLPSDSPKCDSYGNETYGFVSLKCFCKCAGDSAWSQQVRGCLACEHDNGTDARTAHFRCYGAAGWASAPWGTVSKCYVKCFVGGAPPTGPGFWGMTPQ